MSLHKSYKISSAMCKITIPLKALETKFWTHIFRNSREFYRIGRVLNVLNILFKIILRTNLMQNQF